MYKWEGMCKISYQEALERFTNGQEVYLLYYDDTESLVEDIDSIHLHEEHGGEFGYEY
jgi:hypothetical protein